MTRVPIAESYKRPDHAIFDCPEEYCNFHVLTLRGEPTPHKCPYSGGETRLAWMPEGETLVGRLWKEADRCWELYNQTPDEMDARKENFKGRIRGICWALSIFMNPRFTTEDEILREVVKRGRLGSEYETPGIGSRRYEPMPGAPSKYTPKAANPGGLTNEQVVQIKRRPENIPADLMAAGYGVTAAVIEAVRAMPG